MQYNVPRTNARVPVPGPGPDPDADIAAFANIPPPPYPGLNHDGALDLSPTPQSLNRPRLPEANRNPFLRDLPDDASIVKFQTIVRENKEIVVGRIKVPTPGPNSHAFILRRYDTDAVSLTTMFKVAFPGASEDDEKREMEWVRSSYDTAKTNGGRGFDAVRLAGQWVSRHLAIHIAPAYGVSDLVLALSRAVPDPNVAYRKSQRSQAAAEEMAQEGRPNVGTSARPNVPSMTAETASPAPKRQRRATPDASQTGSTRATRSSAGPASASAEGDRHLTLEATTTVTGPANANVDMEAEIASAKQLVLDLKRELRLRSAAGDELEETGQSEAGPSTRGTKRANRQDDAVVISGGAGKGTERVVRTNKRVDKSPVAETAKRFAWGALFFGLGVGAATLVPQLAAQYL